MPGKSSNLGQFWQELKRRKVVRVIIVYAAVVFVIIELVDIIGEPLLLPEWTLTLVIVLLAIGFPVAIIFSWIFDITTKGIKKTKPIELTKEQREDYTLPDIDPTQGKSIVVFPFENISPDPDQEYFSDGLTEEIITDLSHVQDIRVISRTSAMQLKGTGKDMKTIARDLNVQYVLEGSVRKAGNALRITAQLIDAINDKHLWAEKYSGTLDDVFDIQEKVSRSIADALKLKLHPEEDKKIAERPIENVHAYEFYFRAKKAFVSIEEKTLDRGLRDIQKGLELVGGNELLYASMGRIYWQYVYAGIKGEEYLIKTEECCKKIFDLNPESHYSYFLLGIIEYKRGKTQEAIKYMEKVIGTDPADIESLKWFQDYYAQNAKKKDITIFEKKLLEIDPLTSFDEYSLQIPVVHREEIRNILQYVKKPKIAIPGIFIILILSFVAIWFINRQAKIKWVNEQALPEIEQLFNEMNHAAAFLLVQKAEKYIAEDAKFKELSSLVSTKLTILTNPPGADIYLKEYADLEGDWRFLGTTPIDSIRMPNWTFYRWKIEKPGYETILAAATTPLDTLYRTLHKTGEISPDMVYVEGYGDETSGNFLSEKHGFFIDKYEVSNKQFKEFVDKGGYQNSDYWKHEFIKDEKTLSWEEAINYFKDATGRSGPAAWQVGDYPDGKDDYPVTGISWHEATAYAEYAGKNLPTANHWRSAAGYYIEPYSFWAGSNLIPLSNFRGNGPEPIGSSQAINYFGVYDIIGNVREWCWNKTQDGRIIRGGAWNDANYMSTNLSQLPTFDRSLKNGFRCVLYLDKDQIPEQAFQPIKFNVQRDFYKEKPVTEVEFQIFKNQFLYDKAELNAEIQDRDENPENWIVEKISFNAAYENERMIAYLFLPKNSTPPYQTVIFFPGIYAKRETDLIKSFISMWFLDFVLKSGRAVMYPVYKGTYERNDGQYRGVRHKSHTYTEYLIKLVKDFSRSIDYLETRSDIDTAKLGFYGHSWGGTLGAIIPAVEERLKVSILNVGGLGGSKAFPEADNINYISRVKIPVLMLNGKYDFTFPLETAVKPMFDLFGTPDEHKELKIYETDHFVPKNEMIKETLNWLDKYFEPVK